MKNLKIKTIKIEDLGEGESLSDPCLSAVAGGGRIGNATMRYTKNSTKYADWLPDSPSFRM